VAVTHNKAFRDFITDTIGAKLNTAGAGYLVFRVAGSATAPAASVATLILSASAFVTAGQTTAGQASAKAITSDASAEGGTIGAATLQSSAGTYVIHCSVATSGSDINFAAGNLVVTSGDTVAVTSLQYTCQP
jgi:hypothetical protein